MEGDKLSTSPRVSLSFVAQKLVPYKSMQVNALFVLVPVTRIVTTMTLTIRMKMRRSPAVPL